MKTETYDILGNPWTVSVPTTEAEYNGLAKRPNACVEDANDHEVYHGTAGDARESLIKLIEETTKKPRRDKGTGQFVEKDGKKTEVTKKERPGEYYERVCAELSLDPSKDGGAFPDLMKRLSVGGDKEVKFDPSVTRRAAGPKKLPADYRTAAENILNNGTWEKNRKTLLVTAEKGGFYGKDIGAQPKDKEEAITVMGWAIREYSLAEEKARRMERFK